MKADASRRMRWEAAYVDLLLGANQKLAELRDGDMEDSRICAETPNSKEVETCAKLSQSTPDQARIASDLGTELRKLKKAYETLSSKKGKEVSALLSEKDGEIGRLRAEAIGAEKKLQEMHSVVKEKDDEIQKLNGRHHESIEKRNKDISETHTKSRPDDPDATVRGKTENDGLRQILEEDYIPETETVEKDGRGETTQKRRHASSMSIDDVQSGSDADGDEQNGRDKDGDEQSGSDEDGDQQSRSDDDDGQSRSNEHDEDEDEQSGREETTNNLVQNPLGRRTRNAFDAEVDDVKSHIESNGVAKRKCRWYPPPMPLRRRRLVTSHGQRYLISAGNWPQLVSDVKDSLADQPDKCREFVDFLVDFHYRRIGVIVKTMKVLLDGQPELIYRLNNFLPSNHQIKIKMEMKVKEEPQP